MSLKDRLGLDKDPVYLIDGHAFLYRFFYAFRDMARSDGTPTNSLFMFIRMAFGLLRNEKPKYAAVFFDGKGPNFRHELFGAYKAQRPPMPDDLKVQVQPVMEALKLLGFEVRIAEGSEADDCIASLAARFKADRPVVIVGADKDLKQCLDEQVFMWDPGAKKEKLTSLADFREETGLEPEQWPDFQALIGDSADNIPGIPKVGPKTAEKIMAAHPTLEDLRKAVEEGAGDFKPAMRKRLEEHIDDAFLYRKLTRLASNACDDARLEDFSVLAAEHDVVKEFLEQNEFRTLLRELPQVIAPGERSEPAPVAPAASSASNGGPDQGSLFDSMGGGGETVSKVSVTEVMSPDAMPDCAGKSIGVVPAEKAGFHLGVDAKEYLVRLPAAVCAPLMGEAARLNVPDAKEFLRLDPAFAAIGIGKWFDLGLAAYLLSPEDRNYSWERLSQRVAPEVIDEPVSGEGLTALAMGAGIDRRLKAARLTRLMREMEMPLVPVLARMERNGIRIDVEELSGFLAEVHDKLDASTKRIYELAGEEFNLRSSQQMAKVLFTDLGLKPRGKTPGGVPSTSFAVLEKIKKEHPVVEEIQAWRKLEKMRSTYLEPLPKAAGEDGRIHTTFNQLATATGRLSSSAPNLQNIPIRGDMGLRMRACFTAEPGNLLVAADYSQIELRVLAHYSQERALVDAFRNGRDIHSSTAGILFDKAADEVAREERSTAKTINFGLIYGMGPQKLAGELGIKLTEAKEFIERYFERLSGLRDFYESVEHRAKELGHVTTLAGRRRLLPDINSRSQNLQSQARRQAINTLIQGSAADLIKLAMLAVDSDKELASLGAKLILQVHDELLVECPAAAAPEVGKRLEALMVGIYELDVPLAVDFGVGNNWAEAH